MLQGVNTGVNRCSKDLALAMDLGRREDLRSPTYTIHTWRLREVETHEPEGPLIRGSPQRVTLKLLHGELRCLEVGVPKEQS